jgi:hypothetical protein
MGRNTSCELIDPYTQIFVTTDSPHQYIEWLNDDDSHRLVCVNNTETCIHRQLFSFFPKNIQEFKGLLHWLSWEYVFSSMQVKASFKQELENLCLYHRALARESLNPKNPHFLNVYRTITSLSNINVLSSTFEFSHAIVCGAGHSLMRHLEFLKEFNTHIVAAGNSFPILLSEGITPEYVVLSDTKALESYTPSCYPTLFYQLHANPEVIKRWKGEKILIIGKEENPLTSLLCSLNFSTFETGSSSIHSAVGVSLASNQLILCGVDFSYKEGRRYPKSDNICNEGGEFSIFSQELDSIIKKYPEKTWVNLKDEKKIAIETIEKFSSIEYRKVSSISLEPWYQELKHSRSLEYDELKQSLVFDTLLLIADKVLKSTDTLKKMVFFHQVIDSHMECIHESIKK